MPKKKEHSEWLITKGRLSRWEREQKRRRRIIIVGSVVVAIVVILVTYAVYDSLVSPGQKTVLKVNDVSFNMNDYVNMIQMRAAQVAGNATASTPEEMATQALSTMQQNEVFRQLGESQNIEISSEQTDEYVIGLFTLPEPEDPETGEVPEISAEELYQSFIDIVEDYGASEQDFLDMAESDLIRSELQDIIAERDVPEIAEQVHLYGILIDTSPESDASSGTPSSSGTPAATNEPETVDPAEIHQTIADRLDAGEDFAVLADEFSADGGSKEKGGEIGWYPRGILMIETLENIAFEIELNTLSDLIPVSNSEDNDLFWVIMVTEKEQDRPIEEQQLQRLQSTAFNTWYQEQLKGFTIKNDYLDEDDIEWAIDKAF